ncbi:hypothetical protein [Rhizobium sp. 21-4511-3d]
MQLDWSYIQANWDWAGHMVEAIAIAAVFGLIMRFVFRWRMALMLGLAFAAGHFHGREKRDFEISQHMPPPQLRGYFLWEWSWDQATDFWPAAILCLVFLMAVGWRLRGNSG